jgi:hypothetical protein
VRIVQLVEDLELGGLERLAVDLALAQQKTGHQLMVYCLHGAGPLAEPLAAAGIPVVPFRKSRGFSMSTVLAMAKRLRADRRTSFTATIPASTTTRRSPRGWPVCAYVSIPATA